MDITTFLRRYDNGAGFWNRAGDGKIVQQEIDAGGGIKQMAIDTLTLPEADQRKVIEAIDNDPWIEFFPTLETLESAKLEATLPQTGPHVDTQVEVEAHRTWNELLKAAYTKADVGHNWQTCAFKVNFAPFFEKQDGSIDAAAAKICFRRWFDNAKALFPEPLSKFLVIKAVDDTSIIMKVGINEGRYYPPWHPL